MAEYMNWPHREQILSRMHLIVMCVMSEVFLFVIKHLRSLYVLIGSC